MSLFRISIVALSAIAVAPLFADEPGGSAPKSPFQQAAKNREYLAKFKAKTSAHCSGLNFTGLNSSLSPKYHFL